MTDGDQQQETVPAPASTSQTYQLFEFDFTCPWTCAASTDKRYSLTVGEAMLRDASDLGGVNNAKAFRERENDFFKVAKWSPDGTCLLTNSNDNMLRIFELPSDVYETNNEVDLPSVLTVREGESIYDYCWYPAMNSQEPESCCFLASTRDHPIHMWDAFTGKPRCSYSVIDHREQFVAPNSLTFNLDGTKIYCGLNNMIQIFDTLRPGRDAALRPTTPTRRSKNGQKGVISCLTFNPDRSGLYAAGSYSRSIGLYDETNDELCTLLNRGMSGGVTQLQFSPDGNYLYSASRKDHNILCWDIRNTQEILFRMHRAGDTNQRLSFNLDAAGRYLVTGDQEGRVLMYDLAQIGEGLAGEERQVYSFQAHEDTTASASFHPSYPLVASCSGQRKFLLSDDDDGSGSDAESDEDRIRIGSERGAALSSLFAPKVDNSLKIWRLPGNYVWYVDGYRWEGEATEGEAAEVRMEEETVVVEERTIVTEEGTVVEERTIVMEEETIVVEEERIVVQTQQAQVQERIEQVEQMQE